MEARDVAARMTTFMVLLYSVYMGALLFGGLGLYTGIIPGGGSFALTIVPAIFGGAVIALVASAQLVQPGESRLRRWLAPVGTGVRDARRLLRRGNAGLVGALMWWAFDIACLWACFNAFGHSPAVGVLVLGYFIGMLANTLPLPGGVGGVDGGMIGAFIAFGVDPPARSSPCSPTASSPSGCRSRRAPWPSPRCAGRSRAGRPRTRARSRAPSAASVRPPGSTASATSTVEAMEGFGGFFNDPDFQRRMQEMAEQMQSAQTLQWADNAIKLAVDMTVAAINRVNIQGTTEQQAQQIRSVMATVFPEAVTLVREARQGLAVASATRGRSARCSGMIKRLVARSVRGLVLLVGTSGSAVAAPSCFGAAARDVALPCVNPSLRLKVTPQPRNAPLVKGAPCTKLPPEGRRGAVRVRRAGRQRAGALRAGRRQPRGALAADARGAGAQLAVARLPALPQLVLAHHGPAGAARAVLLAVRRLEDPGRPNGSAATPR